MELSKEPQQITVELNSADKEAFTAALINQLSFAEEDDEGYYEELVQLFTDVDRTQADYFVVGVGSEGELHDFVIQPLRKLWKSAQKGETLFRAQEARRLGSKAVKLANAIERRSVG